MPSPTTAPDEERVGCGGFKSLGIGVGVPCGKVTLSNNSSNLPSSISFSVWAAAAVGVGSVNHSVNFNSRALGEVGSSSTRGGVGA